MFSKQHYVPILKWRRAELRALTDLKDNSKNHITPLLELVMPKVTNLYKDKEREIRKTSDEILAEVVSKFKERRIGEIPLEIQNSWGKRPIFVDFSLLYDAELTTQLKLESLNKIISAGNDLGLNLIPVVNLNDKPEIQAAASLLSKKKDSGLCLRISTSNLTDVKILDQRLNALLLGWDMVKENIDLLIDLKSIDEGNNQYHKYLNLTQEIVDIGDWRNLILASGAAPENLTKCNFGEDTFIPRLDWQSWIQYAHGGQLKRIPTFADYTTRNPVSKDSDQFHSPTSSIRYAVEDSWMIMKGKKSEYGLYLAHAKLLVNDSGRFYGEKFSAADRFISEKAKHYDTYSRNPKVKGTGNNEDWIYVGVNHHLELTAHQLSNLS